MVIADVACKLAIAADQVGWDLASAGMFHSGVGIVLKSHW